MSTGPEPWSPEALALLQRAEAHDTTAGMERVTDYRDADCPVIGVRDEAGALVGAYACVWNAQQRNLYIIAAGGSVPGVDLTAVMLMDMEQRAAMLGADFISLQTRREGLVRKLSRQGFAVHGVILRKLMKAAQ
ncbi:MAG: hypothetical protein ACK52V_16155 [Betaproteobacteria bacterium]